MPHLRLFCLLPPVLRPFSLILSLAVLLRHIELRTEALETHHELLRIHRLGRGKCRLLLQVPACPSPHCSLLAPFLSECVLSIILRTPLTSTSFFLNTILQAFFNTTWEISLPEVSACPSSSPFCTPDIFPLPLARILHLHRVQALNLHLSNSPWDHEAWGPYPPSLPPPFPPSFPPLPGSEIWATLSDPPSPSNPINRSFAAAVSADARASDGKRQWKALLGDLGGFFQLPLGQGAVEGGREGGGEGGRAGMGHAGELPSPLSTLFSCGEEGDEEGFLLSPTNATSAASPPSAPSSPSLRLYRAHLTSPAPLCLDTIQRPLLHALLSPCSHAEAGAGGRAGGREGGRGGLASFLADIHPREMAFLTAEHLSYALRMRRVCG
jgi:hypothetical protein